MKLFVRTADLNLVQKTVKYTYFLNTSFCIQYTFSLRIMTTAAFQHEAGTAMECLSIPITLEKEAGIDQHGRPILRCGFKIGGGIDQDFQKSPQGYSDNGIYCTEVHEGSAAARAGLRTHDKILQCNGYDFTMVTHKKAVEYIKKHPVLNLLVARKGVTHS